MKTIDIEVTLILFLAIVILFLGSLHVYFEFYISFKRKRDYIKIEISRTDGVVKEYWKKKLKKLYIESIPLIGKYIWKLMK